MQEQFTIYTAKNGSQYIQTFNEYFAHALSFIGYRFKKYKTSNGRNNYSFEYSERLLEDIEVISNLRNVNQRVKDF